MVGKEIRLMQLGGMTSVNMKQLKRELTRRLFKYGCWKPSVKFGLIGTGLLLGVDSLLNLSA